jgi:NAD(P)-dependent dehydrogenase (short-subunit alcohol dehydrogenase family)
MSALAPSVASMDVSDALTGVAVVTAAGGGLGEHVAQALAARRAIVLAVDRDVDAAAQACAVIRAAGGRAEPLVADLSDLGSVETIALAAEELGPLRLLVNNAGGWGAAGRQFPDAAPDEWRRVIDLNLVVPMALTQRLLPRLGGGAVVNVSSNAGMAVGAYACAEYAVAKAGMIRFTTSSAGLAESHGVRASCVVPGWIGLPRAHAERAALPPPERPELVPPDLVARTIVDLAEDPTSAGRVVVLEEGQTARRL